jgi:hypothetical protein
MEATSGCLFVADARCEVTKGDIDITKGGVFLGQLNISGDVVKEFKGLDHLSGCNFIPVTVGRYQAQAASICTPWGYEISNKVEFWVVKRKVTVMPSTETLFLETSHVGDPIPVSGKVILNPTISGFLSPIQPSVANLTINVIVTRDGMQVGVVTTATRDDGSFSTAVIPTDVGKYEILIQCTESDKTLSDSRKFIGIVSKRTAGIVAESLLLGKLKPTYQKTYKADEEISIEGRLIYGDFTVATLNNIRQGIEGNMRLKANDVDLATFKTDKQGNFKVVRKAQDVANLLSIDLTRLMENKEVTFKAYFDGDPTYTPCDADTRIWLRGVYISLTVKVSYAQQILQKLKFGEDIKIEGALLKMSTGVENVSIKLDIKDQSGGSVLVKGVMTGKGGIFTSSFKVDGAPPGEDGTYTINASYVDADTGGTYTDSDTVDLEKWTTSITMSPVLVQKATLQKFFLGVPGSIDGQVNYIGKGGGPSGMKVALYEITEIEDQGSLIDHIRNLALKGLNITSADRQEIRDMLATLSARKTVAESNSTLAGLFSLKYTPSKLGQIVLVTAAFENRVTYGSFQVFTIEVVKTPVELTLAASERNVKLNGSTTLSGKLTLFEHPSVGVQDQIDIYYDEMKDMGGTKKLITGIKNQPDGSYSSVWTPDSAGFYVLIAKHPESPTISSVNSPATSVAVYYQDANGNWIDPLDGSSYVDLQDLIKHLNQHHQTQDNLHKTVCASWKPYQFGNIVKYIWCRTKEFLGIGK